MVTTNLIFSRKKGESLKIGHNVTVTIERIGESAAKLSIHAPKAVMVHRSEVYERIYEAASVG